jgi:ubiquitin carboxyl-terminal hydrolase 47
MEVEKGGREMYELYSVLVHSGSAFGGHYYAYIKDLGAGKWYKFNDATVTQVEKSN